MWACGVLPGPIKLTPPQTCSWPMASSRAPLSSPSGEHLGSRVSGCSSAHSKHKAHPLRMQDPLVRKGRRRFRVSVAVLLSGSRLGHASVWLGLFSALENLKQRPWALFTKWQERSPSTTTSYNDQNCLQTLPNIPWEDNIVPHQKPLI